MTDMGVTATATIHYNQKGEKGAVPRGPQAWSDCAVGYPFQAGGNGDTYFDTILYNGNYYTCSVSHAKTADNYPGSTEDMNEGYWKLGDKVDLIATRLFLSQKAIINNLIAAIIKTGEIGTPHIEMEGPSFKIYSYGQYPIIELSVNVDKKGVLRFFDEDTGEPLYDLGPSGIMNNFEEIQDSWTSMQLKALAADSKLSAILNVTSDVCTMYYRFTEGYKVITSSNMKKYHISGTDSPSDYNTKYFDSKSVNTSTVTTGTPAGNAIADGWYVQPNNGFYRSNAVVCYVYIYCFSGGKMVNGIRVYFTSDLIDDPMNKKSVGTDENGNDLSLLKYPSLWSYYIAEHGKE
jgi:hypothetical protein